MSNLKILVTTLFVNSIFGQVHFNENPRHSMDGKITVYFTGTIDSSKALPGNFANALDNLEQRAIDAIAGAAKSVDIAAYELKSPAVVQALCKTKERGVRVRIVTDNEANKSELWESNRKILKRYGVPILDDEGWPLMKNRKKLLPGNSSQMHDKFIIVDGKEVLTGSYNFSPTGLISMQNLVVLRSSAAAKSYTEEFEVMWGGSGEVPDTTSAKFHQYKTGLKTSSELVPKKISVFFAPMNKEKTRRNFLQLIADTITIEAKHDIKICAFSFSEDIEISAAIQEKFEKENIDVMGVFDNSLARGDWTLYNAMTQNKKSKRPWNIAAKAFMAFEDNDLHHKYILIDAENPDKNDVPIVITGSFNFSKNANEKNDDNFLIIRDREIVNQYLQEFYARYNKAKSEEKKR